MIRPAIKTDANSIAKLHRDTLEKSFLSGLGVVFLSSLYNFLIKNELVLVYTENNILTGFVSFSKNSKGMMKRFLVNCPLCLFLLGIKILIQPTLLKRLIETYRAPFKSEGSTNLSKLPASELLSISVSPNCQAAGIGTQLILLLENHLKAQEISRYKVIAGEELIGANRFYIKNGFTLISQIKIHGNNFSNVYIKEIVNS